MYVLIVKGARRATLAYHRCESYADLQEMLAVYQALGYTPESLLVEKADKEKAA
jgi:hypothetical protein